MNADTDKHEIIILGVVTDNMHFSLYTHLTVFSQLQISSWLMSPSVDCVMAYTITQALCYITTLNHTVPALLTRNVKSYVCGTQIPE